MVETSLTVPAIALVMGMVSLIIGRRIPDPSAEIKGIAARIDEETKAIRQYLHSDQFRKSESKNGIAEATRKIAGLSADLRHLRVCKQIFSDTNLAFVLTLGLFLPLVFLLVYPLVSSEGEEDFAILMTAVSILTIISVLFLGGMSIFNFMIYRLHRS